MKSANAKQRPIEPDLESMKAIFDETSGLDQVERLEVLFKSLYDIIDGCIDLLRSFVEMRSMLSSVRND